MPTTTPFNNLITFSRGSNATLIGPNGLIQWAPNNLLTFSEQFDNAGWQKFGGGVATAPAVTANAGVAPDGTTTADRIQFALNGGTTSTDRSLLSQSVTLATSFPYTYSIWVRSLSGILSMGIGCDNLVGNTPITVTTEWQRFTVSGTATGTAGVALLQLRGGQTPVQSNAADVLVWGAQLELGSTATTYNPTTIKNLLGFSEAFDNAAWTKGASSIVTGAQANPVNNLFNAQKLMENTGAATQHYVAQILTTLNAGKPITLSVYAKAGERRYIALLEGFSNKGQYFDLQTGTVGSVLIGAPTSASITAVGNGWYRCSMTTPVLSTTASLEVYLSNSGASISYAGDGNSGVYIYGAQLSDSASLDPYVPTPGAAPSSTAFYGPRFDFDPVTLLPRGLQVEEQRSNLVTYSDDWSNAIWSKAASNCAITSNATVSPDGTTNADKLIPLAGATDGRTNQAVTGSAGTTYTLSVYGKQAEFTNCRLYADDGGSNLASVSYNLATGAIFTAAVAAGTWTSVSTTITPVGNGWWRMTLTWTATGAAPTRIAYWCRDTGNGTSGIFIYGAQLEAGAFATSYIPTVASTVTRSADVATITGQNFAQWYRQDEGCLVVEASNPANGVLYILDANNSTVNEEIRLATTSTSGSLVVWQAGAVQANITVGSMTANAPFKMAAGYAANNTNAALNGTVGTADTGFVSPTVSRLQIGASFTQYLNGHIRSIRFIPARAADFQLQALTT